MHGSCRRSEGDEEEEKEEDDDCVDGNCHGRIGGWVGGWVVAKVCEEERGSWRRNNDRGDEKKKVVCIPNPLFFCYGCSSRTSLLLLLLLPSLLSRVCFSLSFWASLSACPLLTLFIQARLVSGRCVSANRSSICLGVSVNRSHIP